MNPLIFKVRLLRCRFYVLLEGVLMQKVKYTY